MAKKPFQKNAGNNDEAAINLNPDQEVKIDLPEGDESEKMSAQGAAVSITPSDNVMKTRH